MLLAAALVASFAMCRKRVQEPKCLWCCPIQLSGIASHFSYICTQIQTPSPLQEFARLGAKLLMVCRSAERGAAAVAAVQAASGNPDVHLLLCDLSSVSQVRRLVEEYRATCEPLHVLVNNAGVMVHEQGAPQAAAGLVA